MRTRRKYEICLGHFLRKKFFKQPLRNTYAVICYNPLAIDFVLLKVLGTRMYNSLLTTGKGKESEYSDNLVVLHKARLNEFASFWHWLIMTYPFKI